MSRAAAVAGFWRSALATVKPSAPGRPRSQSTTSGRARFAAAERAYEPLRNADGALPASWETITAMAWAPEPGAPIREGEMEIARFPANAIPVRKR